MKRRVITMVGFILIIGTVIILLVGRWIFRPAVKDVESKKADIMVNARELASYFAEDEEGSNSKYLNKIILVKGTVSRITKESSGFSVYLEGPDENSGVLCSFATGSPEESRIQIGNEIVVKGVCSGYLLDVVLNKCTLENY